MSLLPRSLRARARTFVLACAAMLCAGCSLVNLGYNHVDTVALYMARDYLSLDAAQYAEAKARISVLHDWHRREEMPAYVALLRTASARLSQGLTLEDTRWAVAQARAHYRAASARAAREAAPVLATLELPQIAHLEHKLAENNEKYAREYLPADPAKRHRAQLTRMREGLEDWFGSLNREQVARVERFVTEQGRFSQSRFDDRRHRQLESVALIKRHRRAEELAPRLALLFSNPEAGRSEEFIRDSRLWDEAMAQLLVDLDRSLSAQQRARALERLAKFAREFGELAARPPRPASS